MARNVDKVEFVMIKLINLFTDNGLSSLTTLQADSNLAMGIASFIMKSTENLNQVYRCIISLVIYCSCNGQLQNMKSSKLRCYLSILCHLIFILTTMGMISTLFTDEVWSS